MNEFLCYYSCYFGPNRSESNVIKNIPSKIYDCYYFTNNIDTYRQLKETDWKSIFGSGVCKNDIKYDTYDSKFLKCCPHFVNELNRYKFTVYIDTKLILINEEYLISFIKQNESTIQVAMLPHPWWPSIDQAVIYEFQKSMEQEKYVQDNERIMNYINNKKEEGYNLTLPMHYMTGFIIRKQHDDNVVRLNETWHSEIIKCGIQCQISFFFVQQICKGTVTSLVSPLDRFIVTFEKCFNKVVIKKETENGFILWHSYSDFLPLF